MTSLERYALEELVTQLRSRASTCADIRDDYALIHKMATFDQRAIKKNSLESMHRCEGKRQAYSNAADDLEAFLRACEVKVEGRG